jgi:hypothetical protein
MCMVSIWEQEFSTGHKGGAHAWRNSLRSKKTRGIRGNQRGSVAVARQIAERAMALTSHDSTIHPTFKRGTSTDIEERIDEKASSTAKKNERAGGRVGGVQRQGRAAIDPEKP